MLAAASTGRTGAPAAVEGSPPSGGQDVTDRGKLAIVLIEGLTFLACMVGGMVLVLQVSVLAGAVLVFFALGIHLFLRQKYFRRYLAEVRQSRAGHDSSM